MLKVFNATFGPPLETTERRTIDFGIFPNGIYNNRPSLNGLFYNLSLAISDHASKPENSLSINLFIESRAHFKNFDATV